MGRWRIGEYLEYDPISDVVDESISISKDSILKLRAFRDSEKFLDIPGMDSLDHRKQLSIKFNVILDQLIHGVESNPSKLWVMRQFQPVLSEMMSEDTDIREHFGIHIEHIMDILEIESSDGLLSFYLGGVI